MEEVRTKISVEVVLTATFTDLSKGGDTTSFSKYSLLFLPVVGIEPETQKHFPTKRLIQCVMCPYRFSFLLV